jgi:hypothetical protein
VEAAAACSCPTAASGFPCASSSGAALARLDADVVVASEGAAAKADSASEPAIGAGTATASERSERSDRPEGSDRSEPSDQSARSDQSGTSVPRQAAAPDATGHTDAEAAPEDEAQGKPEAAVGQEHAAAASTDPTAEHPAGQQPAGHFTVPTAVAVVPAAPTRRPAIEGGFDFFGTKENGADSAALEAVQNEDLADVVGQEALDQHKAETEDGREPASAPERAVGHVIDLTAHDETEQIDVQGLHSAAS